MLSATDEGKGLVKVYWRDVRDRVAALEPAFAKIVDELEPGKNLPLYLAYYPYGMLKDKAEAQFYPAEDGRLYRLTDHDAPKEVVKDLGYSNNALPLGMVLKKNIEQFIDLKHKQISIPWVIHKPGDIFSFTHINNTNQFNANQILTTSSGVRSVFMLPNIGCITNHANLQRDFNIKSPPPKSLYQHWDIFKGIVNSEATNSDWRSCVLFFSVNWIEKIHNDTKWIILKKYLFELAWNRYEFYKNELGYAIAFSLIQEKRNLKPNPYLVDTAHHLFKIISGKVPGYAPACSNDSLPLELIQNAFVSSYGLKKYIPTIIHPVSFNFKNDKQPIYYSLQHPSTYVFSPKARKTFSKLIELRELAYIMRVYCDELSKKSFLPYDPVISEIIDRVELNYFHNETDSHKTIRPSTDIAMLDERFNNANLINTSSAAVFSSDAPFVRGCISINAKLNEQKQ